MQTPHAIYSTGLDLPPPAGRHMAEQVTAYLRSAFLGYGFVVEQGPPAPTGRREYRVLLQGTATTLALSVVQAAALAFADGFRAGWQAHTACPDVSELEKHHDTAPI